MRDSPALDRVRDDCLHLLMTAAALIHRATTFDVREAESRLDLHMWAIQLRAIEDNLIVRICRFDDEGKNQTHLRGAYASVRESVPEPERIKITSALKAFRQEINPMKTQQRNKYAVHLDVETTQPHDATTMFSLMPILDTCRAPLHIVDAIVGKPVGYVLRSGSQEQLDLRTYCRIDEQS